ncbi:MAG: pyridoxamine 5'-phosphate oxidase [Longimicrobiales bacterium]|nr:pyridoxamine 5'-phosphate oxidase [Longimicrobiales bacterium]
MSLKSSIKTMLTLEQGVASGLPEAAADMNPIALFRAWHSAAEESGIALPESMTLATSTAEGIPSARTVLLKGVDERGFVFYTNYGSRKAGELEANPHAALCFHWAVLERQVRVTGHVERVSREESLAYFTSRGKGSRIGAWASRQSEPLEERSSLEAAVADFKEQYPGEDVPLPPHWGGYLVRPDQIEFWQGRADRLHDRLVFSHTETGWSTKWLYP